MKNTEGIAITRLMLLGIMMLVCVSSGTAQQPAPGKAVPVNSVNEDGKVLCRYMVVYKNGGPEGFYSIQITSDDDAVPMETLLIATEPGFDKAEIGDLPVVRKDPPRLIDYAKEQIAQGTLQGDHSLTDNGVLYEVTWHAMDRYNLTIEEIHSAAE